jgi:hypothetical protein
MLLNNVGLVVNRIDFRDYIPNLFQNAIFGLLLFARVALKKIRNGAGYSSFFSTPPAQKSSRPKPSILKDIGSTQF